jgi:cell division protease FtsH
VAIHAETEERSWLARVLIAMLPWLLLIGFFVYSSRKFQERMGMGKGGGVFGFGKSKARLYDRSMSDLRFSDVAGAANAKKELQETISFLKNPGKFEAVGGKLPKGVLLVGPPGVGKTLLAKATAGEADVPFYSISGSEFVEMFVGVGASRVRDMFKRAKKDAPTIIFIDELDSIGRVRGTGLGGGHDEREQTLNQILNEMDGFSPNESIMVMAATNRPDVLDPALIRPGRFDRQITLELPQKKARREILAIHTKEIPLAYDVDLESLAERTVGLSGADLSNLVNEAALLAARKDKKEVDDEDLSQARDKILMGLEREDVLSDEEKKIIAYHEAGHTLLAKLLPGTDPLGKVTIIPRGRSLGATEQIPEEDRHNLKRSYLMNRIAIMLAGREAEKIVFQDISTGAGDDLKKATQLARRMVCQWGMSEKLGAVTFRQGEPHPFLGKELSEQKDYSEHTAQLIDEEIRNITQEMEKRAGAILKENRDKLDALAGLLLEQETATNEEIDHLFTSNPVPH